MHLSRRLRRTLQELYQDRWQPDPQEHVLPGLDPANFRHREWRRIVKRADLPSVRMKDLRDTFASQLLACGVQLGYVSAQLGHADVGVTARHYARWIEADEYASRCACAPARSRRTFLRASTKSPPRVPSLRSTLKTPTLQVRVNSREPGAPGTTRTCDL